MCVDAPARLGLSLAKHFVSLGSHEGNVRNILRTRFLYNFIETQVYSVLLDSAGCAVGWQPSWTELDQVFTRFR